MKSNKVFAFGVLGLAVLSFIVFLIVQKEQMPDLPPVPKADDALLYTDYSPVYGLENAPVKIVEFLDPECEACRMMFGVTKRLINEFPGKVKLVVRYMPLHPNSKLAANSLEAARDQGKFWEALELLFKNQPEWGDHQSPKPELIRESLATLGLDMEKFDSFMKSEIASWKIAKDSDAGRALGVRATPTFFVNGRVLSEIGYAPLRKAIEFELNEKK